MNTGMRNGSYGIRRAWQAQSEHAGGRFSWELVSADMLLSIDCTRPLDRSPV